MTLIPVDPLVRERCFMAIKYLTYGVLCWNGVMFFVAEAAAAEVTFSGSLRFSEIIEVYSASIDTTFWIMLVILLELETYLIDDVYLKKPSVKWTLIGLRSLCYLMIIYALYGYIVKVIFQSAIVPFAISDVCSLIAQDYSLLTAIEEYVPITASNCASMSGPELYRLNGYNIIAPLTDLAYARNVAWIDVFNASSWLGVVAILEVDVWYQLQGGFKGLLLKVSNILKVILYTMLFVCAVAWGYTGVLLDFADAFLWLFAFFFIELNLFQWQQETAGEAEATSML